MIVTGQSGAGRTLALRAFEDLGYYCVDNLPPALLGPFSDLVQRARVKGAAIAIDVRGGAFFRDLDAAMLELQASGVDVSVVFLEADEDVLVHRYKLSRRGHPLGPDRSLLNAIRTERAELLELRSRAAVVLDTSHLAPAQLRERIGSLFALNSDGLPFQVRLISFGFKHGIPTDADLVLDVRYLPNPHYVQELKSLNGTDAAVREWVLKWPQSRETMTRLSDLLHFLLPLYRREGKATVSVAVGCTGGQHRSVVFVDGLGERIREWGFSSEVEHRDIELGSDGESD